MDHYINIPDLWLWFCILLGGSLLCALIMGAVAVNFLTYDGFKRRFSIMELELPSNPKDISNIIGGIYKLEDGEKRKCLRALRSNLLVDFLYMPCTYGAIFLLCTHVASEFESVGQTVFSVLAWLQAVAFLFDILENTYLLGRIREDISPSSLLSHRVYAVMVMLKWLFALVGVICALHVLAYFWLSHVHVLSTLWYALIALGEIVLFLVVGMLMGKSRD